LTEAKGKLCTAAKHSPVYMESPTSLRSACVHPSPAQLLCVTKISVFRG